MAEQFSMMLQEEPLPKASWQVYILEDPLYVQRRYRYQTRLLGSGFTEFAPSLMAFQQLTHRTPERFATTAIACLQGIQADSNSNTAVHLWQSITDQPFDRAASLFDGAHLVDLCATITLCASFLISQKKPLKRKWSKYPPEWENLITALCVMIEELTVAEQWQLPLSTKDTMLHAPYLNAVAWQELHSHDPDAAIRRFHALLLQQARTGIRLEFNALESMAIYRMLFVSGKTP